MHIRVRERNDRLQASVQQVTLVQAADGSVSHELFEIPPWLTQALGDNAGVSVASVERANGTAPLRNGAGSEDPEPSPPGDDNTEPPPVAGANGHTQPPPNGAAPQPATPPATLRFVLHESDDDEADRARLDGLVTLLASYPGDDAIRLFIHARDGDRIELTLPSARACEELRAAGVQALGPGGGADAIVYPPRTRGVEPLEV